MRRNLDIDDDTALSEIYDYFTQRAVPSQPFARPETFTPMLDNLGRNNDRVRVLDVRTLLDASFVQSAIDRGLAR
jgi:hypothetical protein